MKSTLEYSPQPLATPASRLARLTEIDQQGRPWVEFNDEPGRPVLALSAIQIPADRQDSHIGQSVLVTIVEEDNPVIVGFLHTRIIEPQSDCVDARHDERPADHEPASGAQELTMNQEVPRKIEANQKRVVISSDSEIVLKCGDSSLQLRKDGRVVLKGCHIVSRATKKNRIKGGSVAIN